MAASFLSVGIIGGTYSKEQEDGNRGRAQRCEINGQSGNQEPFQLDAMDIHK
jgi:hypothetical protein